MPDHWPKEAADPRTRPQAQLDQEE